MSQSDGETQSDGESDSLDEKVKTFFDERLRYTKSTSDGGSSNNNDESIDNTTSSVKLDRRALIKREESAFRVPIPKTESFREVVEEMVPYVICPWYRSYQIWWGNSLVWSIITIFFETYEIAFVPGGLDPLNDNGAILTYVFNAIFLVDILINFNLAYWNERDELVVDRRVIARKYLKGMFWIDLLGVVPFYIIVLACSGLLGVDNKTTQYLAFLRLFRLVRLHRVVEVFEAIKYSSQVSLMTLTLVRNFGAALVWTHFAACVMYFIARQYNFDEDETWIGGMLASFEDSTDLHEKEFERYLTSMYWSIVTFTTVGYGDFSPVNATEQVWGMVYMLLNMILVSWMIGSMTLLIVKNDERTGKFRDMMQVLDQYSTIHSFDRKFKKRLKRQIEIDFKHRDTSDEVVLEHFPSTTRRKVLRRLYLPALKQCRLMRGVRQQFMDAFFRVCKVEIISPGEDIVQRGNIAADLYFLLEGTARLIAWDSEGSSVQTSTATSRTSVASSENKHEFSNNFRKQELDQGEFINEISFFTEAPQSETIRTMTLCKTLTLPRFAYKSIIADHPGSLDKILKNLLSKVDELAKEVGISRSLDFPKHHDAATVESDSDISNSNSDRRTEKVQVEIAFKAAREIISMHINKQKDDHTTKFLYAASRDDTATLRLMLEQSFDPNSSDYDRRTALMVAAMKGSIEAITLLLSYKADPNLRDEHGNSALLEATKRGHEEVMEVLVNKGASLCLSEMESASILCQAVCDGNILLLQRLLKAKIQVNAGDYDKRTASHIAVADGNLSALKALISNGADLTSQDRWGSTIIDDAKRNGYMHILQYLNSLDKE